MSRGICEVSLWGSDTLRLRGAPAGMTRTRLRQVNTANRILSTAFYSTLRRDTHHPPTSLALSPTPLYSTPLQHLLLSRFVLLEFGVSPWELSTTIFAQRNIIRSEPSRAPSRTTTYRTRRFQHHTRPIHAIGRRPPDTHEPPRAASFSPTNHSSLRQNSHLRGFFSCFVFPPSFLYPTTSQRLVTGDLWALLLLNISKEIPGVQSNPRELLRFRIPLFLQLGGIFVVSTSTSHISTKLCHFQQSEFEMQCEGCGVS